jgi:hypothetical protein
MLNPVPRAMLRRPTRFGKSRTHQWKRSTQLREANASIEACARHVDGEIHVQLGLSVPSQHCVRRPLEHPQTLM